jgi:hypothetical protein
MERDVVRVRVMGDLLGMFILNGSPSEAHDVQLTRGGIELAIDPMVPEHWPLLLR